LPMMRLANHLEQRLLQGVATMKIRAAINQTANATEFRTILLRVRFAPTGVIILREIVPERPSRAPVKINIPGAIKRREIVLEKVH